MPLYEDDLNKSSYTNVEYVQTQHRDYIAFLPKWQKVSDVVSGDVNKYLRNVGKLESNPEAQKDRQKEYEEGGIFYNFLARTINGMLGAIYRKDPEVDLPKDVEYLLTDADGNGQGIVQQSQDTTRNTVKHSRCGLFVDVPSAEAVTGDYNDSHEAPKISLEQQREGLINPKIQLYDARSIINWRVGRYGSANRIEMIVLKEEYEYVDEGANEFYYLIGNQYRVLDFDEEGYYRQRVFKFDRTGAFVDIDSFNPEMNGSRMTEIPFVFVGSENNDYTVDDVVSYPLAVLNIGHYRNSTDHEEFLHILAQAMLVVAPGKQMTPPEWKKQFPNGLKYGASTAINVAEGGNAFLLQANPNQANSEAMKQKEQQAVQIGAQLITPSSQETAEAARIKQGADTSVLATISNNVSDAYMTAISWCMGFLGSTGDYHFCLSKDFFFEKLTPQERAQWVMEIQAGITPKTLYYDRLRQTGEIDPKATDEDIDEMLVSDGGLDLGVVTPTEE